MARIPKPGVGRTTHLFLSPFLWSVIGCVLIYRGWGWLGGGSGRLLVLVALVIGSLKGYFVLDKTACRCIDRIRNFGDSTCIGAVYSWRSWLLVLLMMAFGITMRTLTDPGPVIGTLYVAIGWALIFSSRLGWRAWWRQYHGH